MSRAIVFNKAAFQRMYNSLKNKISAIQEAGFPKEIADMSLPGFGIGMTSPLSADLPLPIGLVMSFDSPVPLSLMEYTQGNTAFHIPENPMPIKGNIKKVSRPATIAAEPFNRPIEPEAEASPVSVPKHSDVDMPQLQASANIDDKQEETDNNIIANSIMAMMKENNLETREPETLSPSVTRITIDDLLGQRNIKIPEYVMVRR